MRAYFLLFGMTALFTAGCTPKTPGAASSDFDPSWAGTYTYDASKSQVSGMIMIISKNAGSEMLHMSAGEFSYDFATDGKDYTTYANHTYSFSPNGESEWKAVAKIDGKVLSNDRFELSTDNKSLTINSKGVKPDGTPFNDTDIFERVGEGKGFLGTWKLTKENASGPEINVLSFPTPGEIRFENPQNKSSWQAKADGSDNKVAGKTSGRTFSLQKGAAPREFRCTWKLDGKVQRMCTLTFAADGKSFTVMKWVPGKESEKEILVFVK